MTFDLTASEARFLLEHIAAHLTHVNNELIHTDKRQLQRELARDVATLEAIRARLALAIDVSSATAAH